MILDEQSQIEDVLQQYFSNIGNYANNMQDVDNFKDNVRKRVAKLDENLVPTTDMFSLRFSRSSIETSLKNPLKQLVMTGYQTNSLKMVKKPC